MDPRLAMKTLGAGRAAIGLGLLAMPAALGRPWIGEAAAGFVVSAQLRA